MTGEPGAQPCPTCAELKRERFHLAAANEQLTLERDSLRDQVRRLVEGLRPFATAARHFSPYPSAIDDRQAGWSPTIGMLRRAAALVAEHEKQEPTR